MIELIAILSLALDKYTDFAVALGLLIVNGALSFLQEQHATAAVDLLKRRLQATARATGDGRTARRASSSSCAFALATWYPTIIDGSAAVDQSICPLAPKNQ
ncbi:MAG: hypothetical protein KGO02_14980 [Alphaproteobacteria bacterium]|nr:hypothetical protein [Alphaproteobacteria bacterium]